MRPKIRSIFPELGVMGGYAVTARIRAAQPPAAGEPAVVTIQDLDDPPAVGSYWGEVQANIHKALGCAGAVTNGGVRDLNEVGALGFHLFAGHVVVSHAYVRMVDYGGPVELDYCRSPQFTPEGLNKLMRDLKKG